MRQIPLRGGPLDGKTVPAASVHDGRYTEHRIAEAPRVTFNPGHDPTGPIEEAPLPRESVVYELRRTYTPEYTATYNEALRLRREYEAASEEERRDMVSMLTRVEGHLLRFGEVKSLMFAEEWLEYTGRV